MQAACFTVDGVPNHGAGCMSGNSREMVVLAGKGVVLHMHLQGVDHRLDLVEDDDWDRKPPLPLGPRTHEPTIDGSKCPLLQRFG